MNDTDGNPVAYRTWYWAKVRLKNDTRTFIGQFKRLGKLKTLVVDSAGLLLESRYIVCFTRAHVPNEYQEP